MSVKGQRQEKIAELIHEHSLSSQTELLDHLAGVGFHVTQATLSRDLREMGVFKGPDGYVLPASAPAPEDEQEALTRALRRELRSIDRAVHTIVIKADPGHASGLALAIDRARLDDVLGTIAGDDTIMIIARSQKKAESLARRLERRSKA